MQVSALLLHHVLPNSDTKSSSKIMKYNELGRKYHAGFHAFCSSYFDTKSSIKIMKYNELGRKFYAGFHSIIASCSSLATANLC